MKLFLLFMLIQLTAFGQIMDTTLTGIQLDDEVFLQVLKDFTKESRKEQIFIDHFISQDLGGIKILTEEDIRAISSKANSSHTAGITYRIHSTDAMGYWHTTPMIGIREDMMDKGYRLIKAIIYHELGHFFGIPHLDKEELKLYNIHVMCPVFNGNYMDEDISEDAMKHYWGMLKKANLNRRWKRGSNNR